MLMSVMLKTLFVLATYAPIAQSAQVKLWVSKTCPYAAKAWCAFNERVCTNANVDFELRMVDLQEKPEDFNSMYASISPWGTDTSSKVQERSLDLLITGQPKAQNASCF
jgi:hypothetical protein